MLSYAPVSNTHLEILSHRPPANGGRDPHKPPLLFVHGGYCDAWCWNFYFLPYLAARGYVAHAVSLRGHGGSAGHEQLASTGLADYADDVVCAAAGLSETPILIGHSMGAAVVERALERLAAPAAALLAPVPPTGLLPVVTRIMGLKPDFFWHIQNLDGAKTPLESLAALRTLYFTDAMPASVLAELVTHLQSESPRAIFELSFPASLRPRRRPAEVMVLGGELDALFTPAHVAASAARYDLEPIILPDLPHMFMLEPGWERAAQTLADWLDERFG